MATPKQNMSSQNETKRSKSEHCSAINCNKSRQFNRDISFFRFPKDPERSKRWLLNSRRLDLLEGPTKTKRTADQLHRSYVFCCEHFEDSQFTNPATRSRLNRGSATPTLFNIPNPPPQVTPIRPPPSKRPHTSLTSTSSSSSPEPTSTEDLSPPSKRSLLNPTEQLEGQRKEIAALRKQVSRRDKKLASHDVHPELSYEELKAELSKYLKGNALDLVLCQIRMTKTEQKGRRWTSDCKRFAISIYHSSPKTYRMIRKIFLLPSISTLKRLMQKVHLDTGFDNNIVHALKAKVATLNESDKLCALVFDEMAIKESLTYNAKKDCLDGFEEVGPYCTSKFVANHATVFLVRGIMAKWKQPFSFFFSSGPIRDKTLSLLIREALLVLKGMGLKVKVIICDQGSNNRSALKNLGLTFDTPFIEHDEEKVYVFYDPPHLLKNVGNNFKKYGFKCNGQAIDWNHLEQFYHEDAKLPVRFAPKLTARHIQLPPFTSLKVKLAAQVLSHSVYAGISTMVTFGRMDQACQATADFVKRFDSLFNCFNSQRIKSQKPFGHAISTSSSHQAFLQETYHWLDKIESNSKSKLKLPCIQGWQMAIKSLQLLLVDLTENENVKFLLGNRLNQDCLENLFSMVRGKGGHRDNPNATEFPTAMKQIMIDSIFSMTGNKNCQDDLDHFLFHLAEHQGRPPTHPSTTPATQQSLKSPDQMNRRIFAENSALPLLQAQELEMQNVNVLSYIGGYMIKKAMSRKKIPVCNDCLKKFKRDSCMDIDNPKRHEFFTKHKLYKLECDLVIPSELLVGIIIQLEHFYNQLCEEVLHSNGVKKVLSARLLAKLQLPSDSDISETCRDTCVCFLVRIFVNIRLHHTLKLNNNSFKKTGMRRNRKLIKLQHV